MPTLSVVIPVYNEERNLDALYARLAPVLNGTGQPYEVIFVDDGSADGSLEILRRMHDAHRAVRVIALNRNYGQHAAVFAGLDHARGEAIVTLDADLQNPPEEIPHLLAQVDEGHDVVGGWRQNRQDPLIRRLLSWCMNRQVNDVLQGFDADRGSEAKHIADLVERAEFLDPLTKRPVECGTGVVHAGEDGHALQRVAEAPSRRRYNVGVRVVAFLHVQRSPFGAVSLGYDRIRVALEARRHSLDVVTPDDIAWLKHVPVRLYVLLYPWAVALRLRRRRARYDLAVFHSYTGWVWHLVWKNRLRTITAFHGMEPIEFEALTEEFRRQGKTLSWRYRPTYGPLMNAMLQRTCRGSDRVLCLNSAEADLLVDRGWTTADRITVVTHGVPPEGFVPDRVHRPKARRVSG